MKIVKKEMKDALVTIKRFIKDKTRAKIFVQTDGEKLKVQAYTKEVIAFYILENLGGEDDLAFLINPYELEPLLKGKNKEMEFTITNGNLVNEFGSASIELTEKRTMNALKNTIPFENQALFLDVLREAETLLHESEKTCTSYLKLTSKRALAAEPKRIHFYRLDEDFQFEEGYIHKDIVSMLTKSLKGTLTHGKFKNAMVLAEDEKTFFFINIEKKIDFPLLKKIIHSTKLIAKFDVDATVMNNLTKTYKKKVKELEFTPVKDFLFVDPREEESQKAQLDVKINEGVLQKVLFDADTVKGLFTGYNDTVEVEHYEFKNTFGEKGYMWRITTIDKITMAAGIEEPNWDANKIGNNN